jgi:uncharacterized membrane protein YgdD (TMEM256/DUF423 family)
MSHSLIARLGALLAGAAVALGAYGAHGLDELLVKLGWEAELTQRLAWFDTGVRYQFFHALALLCVGLAGHEKSRGQRWAAAAFLVGITLFSGSLYGLTLLSDAWRRLGAVTPLGGLALLVGWGLLVASGRGERTD